jgi:hypothetical protein
MTTKEHGPQCDGAPLEELCTDCRITALLEERAGLSHGDTDAESREWQAPDKRTAPGGRASKKG